MLRLRRVTFRSIQSRGENMEYIDLWLGGWCEKGTKSKLDTLGIIQHPDGSHSKLDMGVMPDDLYKLLKKSIGVLNNGG